MRQLRHQDGFDQDQISELLEVAFSQLEVDTLYGLFDHNGQFICEIVVEKLTPTSATVRSSLLTPAQELQLIGNLYRFESVPKPMGIFEKLLWADAI